MTVMPAAFAWASCVPSWEPSMAPTMSTLTPLVTIAEIWFCCSETPPLANWTSPLKPVFASPSLNSCSARTQFSEVFCGSDTPMSASAGNAAVDPFWAGCCWGWVVSRPHPVRASRATAAPATSRRTVFLRMANPVFRWDGVQLPGSDGGQIAFAVRLLLRLRRRTAEPLHDQPDHGRAALHLVEHVERDGGQQHQALDDLGQVGADAHQLQAVVQDGHHEA